MLEKTIDLFMQIKYRLGYRDRQYNPFYVSHRNKKQISTELFFSLDSLKDVFFSERLCIGYIAPHG
jgi:hypothetical protein